MTTAAPHRFRVGFWVLALLSLIGVAACGDDDHDDDDHEGMASGATCPTTGEIPTYDNFGRSFMSTYCTRCHSAQATDRHGAPADHNFDTLSQIKVMADHIDENAAAGPSAVNTEMPPTIPSRARTSAANSGSGSRAKPVAASTTPGGQSTAAAPATARAVTARVTTRRPTVHAVAADSPDRINAELRRADRTPRQRRLPLSNDASG